MVGYARKLRYVALREDVRDTVRGAGPDAQKRLVETVDPGDVVVIEARGELQAGTIGDILAARVLARGGAGIVTDGGVRDSPGVAELDIPSYCRGANAASLWHRHIPLDIDVPITCAAVLVMPGDIVVGDADGVVVVPRAFAEDVARDALEVEQREAFALGRVKAAERRPLSIVRCVKGRVRGLARVPSPGATQMTSPFAADPSAVRGAITPLVTPFLEDSELDLDRSSGSSTGSWSTALTAFRSADRPANPPRRPSRSGLR
jgi:regulator of RNase E activity RraA